MDTWDCQCCKANNWKIASDHPGGVMTIECLLCGVMYVYSIATQRWVQERAGAL